MKRFTMKMLTLLVCLAFFCSPAMAKEVPYTVSLQASEEIYHGPGVEHGYARLVGEDGVYTIVEEDCDRYGNVWGRLKSGVGWVMLEAAEQEQFIVNEVPYTTALKADEDIYAGPGYDFEYLRDVDADGVYTIVEEAICNDGFLWGRLKSGVGWVRLTDAPIDVPMDIPATEGMENYTVALEAWVSIFDSPSEIHGVCVGIIGEDGVFTIVNEVIDEVGNVWGELRSGAGWVNLNYVRFVGKPPITAYHADVVDLGDSWYECTLDNSEYMSRIAFRANEGLANFVFTTLSYEEEGYRITEVHNHIDFIEEDMYFVAGVVFYGDMTTYGISFTDENGEVRNYAVSLSGMNGAVVMNEYVQ